MPKVSAAPQTITPEAAEHVATLGMQAPLERMLDHTRQTVPGLHQIRVTLAEPYDAGDEPRIVIEAMLEDPRRPDDPTETTWDRWFIDHFPPDVGRHFCFLAYYVPADGR
jgi:hypothetical protein